MVLLFPCSGNKKAGANGRPWFQCRCADPRPGEDCWSCYQGARRDRGPKPCPALPAASLPSPSCALHPPWHRARRRGAKKNGAPEGAVLVIVAFSLHDDPAPPSAGAIVAEAGIADIVEVADHGPSIGRPGRRVNAAAAGRRGPLRATTAPGSGRLPSPQAGLSGQDPTHVEKGTGRAAGSLYTFWIYCIYHMAWREKPSDNE